MNSSEIAATGYGIATVLFLLMATLLLTRWREHSKSQVLALPMFFSAIWAAAQTGVASGFSGSAILIATTEILRSGLWLTALVLILRSLVSSEQLERRSKQIWPLIPVVIAIVTAAINAFGARPVVDSLQLATCVVFGVLIVFVAEQTFRNTPQESGSGLRYFSLAVAGIFIYDIVFIVQQLNVGSHGNELLQARGFANALLALPILYAIRSRFNISLDSLLPRQIVFYSFSLVVISLVVIAVGAGDWFIRRFGGSWSDVLRILFAIGLLMFGTTLIVSRSFRNKSRVVMMKALFQYKYDYRREWLRFIATLSQTGSEQKVSTTAVRAIAQIVNSPGGVVWVQEQDNEDYVPIGSWNCNLPTNLAVRRDSGLVEFLNERQWIIDLDEMKQYPARYDGRGQDGMPEGGQDWWLIVPMLLGERLTGFLTLLRPDDVPMLNFEDHDLLKTAGRHVATHIEQVESDRRLSEARQFGAYNRLTAFLMHDLNNLLAQQSLVVDNAERFRHNPDFVDDAIGTIAHSVDRMRRLMGQLSSASKAPVRKRVNLCSAIMNAVKRTADNQPAPQLARCDDDIHVQADLERLSMVIEHLLRNAQEATPDDGAVTIAADRSGGMAHIAIKDSGSGMTADFVRTRLFRPFDSTKGSQGMGIGVYQAREYARALGGQLEVTSEPNVGTEFRLNLPLA